jgi:hypothetical protein
MLGHFYFWLAGKNGCTIRTKTTKSKQALINYNHRSLIAAADSKSLLRNCGYSIHKRIVLFWLHTSP